MQIKNYKVWWDTSLKSLVNQSQSNLSSIIDQSQSNLRSISVLSITNSKFTSYGQKAVAEAKKNKRLVVFAQNFLFPAECKLLLIDPLKIKNSSIWAKYVFWEAYGINSKELGVEWKKFLAGIQDGIDQKGQSKEPKEETSVKLLFSQYKKIAEAHSLSDKKIVKGIEILLQIFNQGCIDRQSLVVRINKILQKMT